MELTQPLAVIDSLFEQQSACGSRSQAWGEREHFVKVLGLEDEEAFLRIPCINDVELAESMRPFSLVRYRGLVQDIFEPEMYVARVEERDAGKAEGGGAPAKVRTTKYRDFVEAAPGREIHNLKGHAGLGQRGACYCVPLPGERAWARARHAQRAAQWAQAPSAKNEEAASDAERLARAKRSREQEQGGGVAEVVAAAVREADEESCLEQAPAVRTRVSKEDAEATRTVGDKSGCNADEFGLNFPLPWEEARGQAASTACIVKTYDEDAESLRLCEVVEVLGVLCVSPKLANLEEVKTEGAFGADARQPSTALVPRLHALMVRKMPFHHPFFPFSPQWLSEARLGAAYQQSFSEPGMVAAARSAAIAQLARSLGGDALAAEYVLLQLLSRSFATHGDKRLGTWSLNLVRWPRELEAQALGEAAGQLVPLAVCLEVSSQTLQQRRWRPSKDYVANRLLASQLQLAPGTLLVLDETGMAEGKITAPGVKAIGALSALVAEQKLQCDFSAYDVEVPLELSSVVVSQGKSILKDLDVALPLKPMVQLPAEPTMQALDAARLFLGFATRVPRALEIPKDVAQRLAGDFAEVRQEFQASSQLCNTWLSLARAFCVSHGEHALTEERWSRVAELERLRLQRCQEIGMFTAQDDMQD